MERWTGNKSTLATCALAFSYQFVFQCIIPCPASHPLVPCSTHPTSTLLPRPPQLAKLPRALELEMWHVLFCPVPPQKRTVGMTNRVQMAERGSSQLQPKLYSTCTNVPDGWNLKVTAIRGCISIALKSPPSFKPWPKIVGTGSWGLQFFPSGFDEN